MKHLSKQRRGPDPKPDDGEREQKSKLDRNWRTLPSKKEVEKRPQPLKERQQKVEMREQLILGDSVGCV
jgi:hypothetical protein